MADNYRRLGRNGNNGFGRSFSSFFVLLSIVILISLVYLYFTTSSELQAFRNDYDDLNSRHLKLKNEILDLNLKLESMKSQENECKTAKDAAEAKIQTCQQELSAKVTLLTQMDTRKTDCEGTINDLNEKLKTTKGELETEKAENQNHSILTANLQQTIEKLRSELKIAQPALFISSTQSAPVGFSNAPADQGFSAALALGGQPKSATEKAAGAKDTAHEQADSVDKGNGKSTDFIAPLRSPGGRVKLEEQAEQREKFSNHKELIKAAAKLDKQQERMDEAERENNSAEEEEAKEKASRTTEKNRPLVDAVFYRDQLGEKDEQIEFEQMPADSR